MFHVQSSITLRPGETLGTFESRLRALEQYLQSKGLLVAITPIARRFRHPVMDTDAADFDFTFTLLFENGNQVDQSVKCLRAEDPSMTQLHRAVWDAVASYRFACWQDD